MPTFDPEDFIGGHCFCLLQKMVRGIEPITEVWHMAHFWVSYGRCTMPGSPMGRSEGSSRRWTG